MKRAWSESKREPSVEKILAFPFIAQQRPVFRADRDEPEGILDVKFAHECCWTYPLQDGYGIINAGVFQAEIVFVDGVVDTSPLWAGKVRYHPKASRLLGDHPNRVNHKVREWRSSEGTNRPAGLKLFVDGGPDYFWVVKCRSHIGCAPRSPRAPEADIHSCAKCIADLLNHRLVRMVLKQRLEQINVNGGWRAELGPQGWVEQRKGVGQLDGS